jgi:hypothetical protein
MPKGFRFRMGRLTFYYSVLTEDTDLGVGFDLDLIGVWFNNFSVSDRELDAINTEGVYDLAVNKFQKEYL